MKTSTFPFRFTSFENRIEKDSEEEETYLVPLTQAGMGVNPHVDHDGVADGGQERPEPQEGRLRQECLARLCDAEEAIQDCPAS